MAITLHVTPAETIPDQDELVQGRFRDEFQLQIDAEMAALKVRTATAGWPDPDPKTPFLRYVVDSDEVTAMKGVLRRAATLHKVEVDFYKDAKTEAGHVSIKFNIGRKTDKDGKPVKDDTLNADGSPVKPPAPTPTPPAGKK
jgi:hypothetical protein